MFRVGGAAGLVRWQWTCVAWPSWWLPRRGISPTCFWSSSSSPPSTGSSSSSSRPLCTPCCPARTRHRKHPHKISVISGLWAKQIRNYFKMELQKICHGISNTLYLLDCILTATYHLNLILKVLSNEKRGGLNVNQSVDCPYSFLLFECNK
jgi:hypothetical protein